MLQAKDNGGSGAATPQGDTLVPWKFRQATEPKLSETFRGLRNIFLAYVERHVHCSSFSLLATHNLLDMQTFRGYFLKLQVIPRRGYQEHPVQIGTP